MRWRSGAMLGRRRDIRSAHLKRVLKRRRASLTGVRGSAGVPDEDAAVVGRAGEDVVVDRVDGQTVDGVDVQEHVQSFSSVHGATNQALTVALGRRRAHVQFYPPLHIVKDHLLVIS